MLEQILSDNKDVTRIVELGTGHGGLTLFWGLQMKMRGGKVLTFDTREISDVLNRNLRFFNIIFQRKNVFDQATVQCVREFIRDGRALIFCDDGDKPREVLLYAPILKRNDLIMAHDWTSEIKEVPPAIRSTLKFYRQDEFDALKTTILSMVKI